MSLKRRKLHTCFLCEFSKIHFLFVLYCFQELKLEEINTLPLSLPKWLNGDDFFQHDCFDRLKNAPCNAPCFSFKLNGKQLTIVFAPKIQEPKLFSSSVFPHTSPGRRAVCSTKKYLLSVDSPQSTVGFDKNRRV